jgi:hypothetical protein
MGHHPFVVNIVETADDVAFQNPLGRDLPREHNKALFDGIRRGPEGTKSVGIWVCRAFRDRDESHREQGLHGPVEERWNAQRSLFSVLLGNQKTSEREKRVPSSFQ